MSGITGLGTTYALPNYTGALFGLTPTATPFLSAIGGLNGGGQAISVEFEWETYDLRAASQPGVLEGAAAPTAQSRVRANITNVCQIHQEAVSVSYTKLAAHGQKSGTNNEQTNPVMDEEQWQVARMLEQMALDVNWSFLNGRYNKPSDNSTARKTRGFRQAITTNRLAKSTTLGTGLTATASTDKITSTAHGLANGTQLTIANISVANGLDINTVYYLVSTATNDFKVSLTLGGTAVDITADSTVDVIVSAAAVVTTDTVTDLLQTVYDNGGITQEDTATLIVGSAQRRALTKAYASAYGQYHETSRSMGGVRLDTILTDFGTLNVLLDRHMPQSEIAVASMEQCRPVFLEIPGKGHFFAEPLAKTGASDQVQLYGETGLAYGPERVHGILTGLKVPVPA